LKSNFDDSELDVNQDEAQKVAAQLLLTPNYLSYTNYVDKTHPSKQNSLTHASFSIVVCQQGETMLIIAATAMASNSAAEVPRSEVDAQVTSLFFKAKLKTFPKFNLAATTLHKRNFAAKVPPPIIKIVNMKPFPSSVRCRSNHPARTSVLRYLLHHGIHPITIILFFLTNIPMRCYQTRACSDGVTTNRCCCTSILQNIRHAFPFFLTISESHTKLAVAALIAAEQQRNKRPHPRPAHSGLLIQS
jgi:hypothetical protein